MVFFKIVPLKNDLEKQNLELSLRRFASKRHTSLDFQSSVAIGSDKYFLGLEGNKDIKFTRVRTSFEKMLPKLIISLPKNDIYNYYKFRLTFLSTIVFVCFTAALILNLIFLLSSKTSIDKFGVSAFIYGIYFLLILLELKLTTLKITKAVRMNTLGSAKI